MCDKMAISDYILKIVEKDPFLRLQMRAKEMFNHTIVQMYNRTNVQSYKCTIHTAIKICHRPILLSYSEQVSSITSTGCFNKMY